MCAILAPGVAPRAKMNQQRQRRFRAALEAKQSRVRIFLLWGCAFDMLNMFLTCDVHSIVIVSILTRLQEERIRAGEAVNADDIFDSNCITPGTEFMAALSEHLRYFIRKKIKEDASWQKVKVIFSGHEVRCLIIPASIWRFLPAYEVLMRICPF